MSKNMEKKETGTFSECSLFLRIPTEVQEKVAKMLTNYHDVENLFEAYPHLPSYRNLDVWCQEMKNDQVTKKVFDILLHKRYLNRKEALKCRGVSKIWKQSVDEHYRTANIHSATFEGGSFYQYPRATIRVPVCASFATRLNSYASHGGNPFVGNRLLLKCGHNGTTLYPWRSEMSLIQSEQVAHVWQHVHHLEILEDNGEDDDDDDEEEEKSGSDDDEDDEEAGERGEWREWIEVLLRPFLQKMPNVKTVMLNLNGVPANFFLTALPDLASLEQLVVNTQGECDLTKYSKLLKVCNSSLKLLSGTGMLIDHMADDVVKKVKFEKLEELCLRTDGPKMLQYPKNRIDKVFPILKVAAIEFWGEESFYNEFVSITHVFHTLEHIVINCVLTDYFLVSEYVVKPNAARVPLNALKKLTIVNVGNKWGCLAMEMIASNFRALLDSDDKCEIVCSTCGKKEDGEEFLNINPMFFQRLLF